MAPDCACPRVQADQSPESVRNRHGMIKRSNKFIRDARGTMVLAEPDAKKVIKNFLPNGL